MKLLIRGGRAASRCRASCNFLQVFPSRDREGAGTSSLGNRHAFGPVKRGCELSSVVLNQVGNGIAFRMAVLERVVQ